MTCTASPLTYTRCGPHAVLGVGVTGAGGLNQALTVSYTDNVDAGTATASASYAGTANYNASSDTENFTIGKANTTTTVTCTAGAIAYNGAAHTPCSASVTGAGGLNEALTVSYTDNVDAGTATASASYAGTANYNASSDTENTIGKANTTTTVTCTAGPFTYNGAAHTPCSASVTGAGELDQALTVSYTDNVDAGTATASAAYAGTANYNASSDTENFTINKADTTTRSRARPTRRSSARA